ncbi:MAG: hydrogenase nickel incorporation protein HypB [Clostridiales Family XIII bacterium]|jgi:hydrogenase nickel incorporation protein HypB|nr:hydrogenase nickel incorporation protein HypB [Clostridiales Family XIII bacterium]
MENMTKKVEVMEDVYQENDRIAAATNEELSKKGVFVVNVMGAPGAGKTSVLKNLISRMGGRPSYVIEGDIESDIDTRDLRGLGIPTEQINTFGACHLDAPMIKSAAEGMDFGGGGLLFIENIGNLVCPAEFNIGEHVKMLVCSATEGGDKPYKYPLAFEKADVIILNKADLLPYLDFDEEFFTEGVRRLNKGVPVFKVSCKTGEGFDEAARFVAGLV